VASPASGHVSPGARAPWRLRKTVFVFFRYSLKQVVWFGLVLCQTPTQHYLSPGITPYNGVCVCAKVNVVFIGKHFSSVTALRLPRKPTYQLWQKYYSQHEKKPVWLDQWNI